MINIRCAHSNSDIALIQKKRKNRKAAITAFAFATLAAPTLSLAQCRQEGQEEEY